MIETDPGTLFSMGLICGGCIKCRALKYQEPCDNAYHLSCDICQSKQAKHRTSNPKTFFHYFLDRKNDTMTTSYLPAHFPKGTTIRTQGSTGVVTGVTGYGANLTVSYRSDNSNAPRTVKPNIHNSKFIDILRTAYTPKVGDRVDATPNIPGISGSLRGTVVRIDYAEYNSADMIIIKADANDVEYGFSEERVTFQKLEPSWADKLAELKPATVIHHKINRDRVFAMKGTDGAWRNQDGVLFEPAEDMWLI